MKYLLLALFSTNLYAGFLESPFPMIERNKNKALPISKLEDFNETFQSNVLSTLDKKLIVKLDDKNLDFNAYATFDEEDNAVIIVNQGMMNHIEMDEVMLDLFLCHELGHLLGGDPKIVLRNGKKSWSSVEGQADYFATAECMPKLNHHREHVQLAALALTRLIAKMRGYTEAPSIENRDRSRPGYVVPSHPAPQCRLDTMLAGLNKDERPRCWFDVKE